jgi:hypothetical protein
MELSFAKNFSRFTQLIIYMYIQSEAIEYGDIHIFVVMNWAGYKKHKNYGVLAVKCD